MHKYGDSTVSMFNCKVEVLYCHFPISVELKNGLDVYLAKHFPDGLVRMIRMPERRGLIQARLAGFRNSTGEVIIFFDSHMEVNIDW